MCMCEREREWVSLSLGDKFLSAVHSLALDKSSSHICNSISLGYNLSNSMDKILNIHAGLFTSSRAGWNVCLSLSLGLLPMSAYYEDDMAIGQHTYIFGFWHATTKAQKVTFEVMSWDWKTRHVSKYSWLLCHKWAWQALSKHAPPRAAAGLSILWPTRTTLEYTLVPSCALTVWMYNNCGPWPRLP